MQRCRARTAKAIRAPSVVAQPLHLWNINSVMRRHPILSGFGQRRGANPTPPPPRPRAARTRFTARPPRQESVPHTPRPALRLTPTLFSPSLCVPSGARSELHIPPRVNTFEGFPRDLSLTPVPASPVPSPITAKGLLERPRFTTHPPHVASPLAPRKLMPSPRAHVDPKHPGESVSPFRTPTRSP